MHHRNNATNLTDAGRVCKEWLRTAFCVSVAERDHLWLRWLCLCGKYSEERCDDDERPHVLWSLYFNVDDTSCRDLTTPVEGVVVVAGPDASIDYDNAIAQVTRSRDHHSTQVYSSCQCILYILFYQLHIVLWSLFGERAFSVAGPSIWNSPETRLFCCHQTLFQASSQYPLFQHLLGGQKK